MNPSKTLEEISELPINQEQQDIVDYIIDNGDNNGYEKEP